MSTRFASSIFRLWCCLALLIVATLPSRAETVAQTVNKARHNYARIEQDLKHFTRRETELSDFSTEGGDLVAYFQKGAVRKLVAQYYGESGHATEEYYFSGGRLFFVLRTEMHYDKPTEIYGKAARKAQNRSYFADGKLVRWVDENGKIRPAGQEYTTQERETLAQARLLLSKAKALLD